MNNNAKTCRIETGDFVSSAWGSSPDWTPYAQAIAESYPIQMPWFSTTPITVTNPPPSIALPRSALTVPQLHDVLVFGFSATQSPAPDVSGNLYMNITHQETGIPWSTSNQIGFSPLGAFAGINLNPMPVLKLPEAFFLPAHTTLKISWVPFSMDTDPTVTIRLTILGAKLINPNPGFKSPRQVRMPNGDIIPVGSRLPWFSTIPFGARPIAAGARIFGDFSLPIEEQATQFIPPNDCTVEIHDTYASFLHVEREFTDDTTRLKTKMDDTRMREDWTPLLVPTPAVYGSFQLFEPTLPFPKPHDLKFNHKIAMVAQNDSAADVTRGTVTFRGVRLCEY